MPTKKIKFQRAIQCCQKSINSLDELIKKKESAPLSEIEKQCCIRTFCQLGEIMTFFRNPDERISDIRNLRVIPSQNDSTQEDKATLVHSFTSRRNNLLHTYIFQHHLGNNEIYNESISFLEANLQYLSNELNELSKNNMDFYLIKDINPSPEDTSPYNVLDYAIFTFMEIEAMSMQLKDIINQDNDLFIQLHIEEMPHILEATANYIENIGSMLKCFNGRYITHENAEFYEELEGIAYTDISEEAREFLINPNYIRNSIAHSIEEEIDISNFPKSIKNAVEIKEIYLPKVIIFLLHNEFKINQQLKNSLPASINNLINPVSSATPQTSTEPALAISSIKEKSSPSLSSGVPFSSIAEQAPTVEDKTEKKNEDTEITHPSPSSLVSKGEDSPTSTPSSPDPKRIRLELESYREKERRDTQKIAAAGQRVRESHSPKPKTASSNKTSVAASEIDSDLPPGTKPFSRRG